MPALVTAAHQRLSRRIARRLLDEGGEVRAYADGDVSLLRAAGAIVATGEVDDEGRLEAAMAQVHTVVHVGGGLLHRDAEAIDREAAVVARAAENAGVRRLVALSLPGADPDAADPLRRAKGRAERHLAAAEVPTVVLRLSWVDTDALLDAMLTSGLGREFGETEIAPVRVEDVVELVVEFDRARSSAASGHLVVAADGPERLRLAEWLERRTGRASGHAGAGSADTGTGLVGRRLVDEASAPLLRSAVGSGPWTTSDPVAVDGWSFTGIEPRPVGP